MSNLNYAFTHSNISTLPQIFNQIFTSTFILSNLNYASRHSNMPTWHQICTQKSKTITHTSVGFRNFKLHNWITSTTGRVCRWHTLLKLPIPVVFSLGLFKWQTRSRNFTSLHIMVIAHQCLILSKHNVTNTEALTTKEKYTMPKWLQYLSAIYMLDNKYNLVPAPVTNMHTTSIVDSCSKLGCSHWESDCGYRKRLLWDCDFQFQGERLQRKDYLEEDWGKHRKPTSRAIDQRQKNRFNF